MSLARRQKRPSRGRPRRRSIRACGGRLLRPPARGPGRRPSSPGRPNSTATRCLPGRMPAPPIARAPRRSVQPETSHPLPRVVEPLEVPDLGNHRHRDDEPDAAHCPDCVDHRGKAPVRQKIRDLPRQALHSRLGIRDGVDVILKDDLLRHMRETHQRQPPPVRTSPALLPGIDPAVSTQDAL